MPSDTILWVPEIQFRSSGWLEEPLPTKLSHWPLNVKVLMPLFSCFVYFRCLPVNFRAEDLASGILRERVKVGASLADVDPMNIDKSVSL